MESLIKVLEPCTETPALPAYLKMHCPYCWSLLAFRNVDAWVEDPEKGIGRIECPICHRKVFFQHDTIKWVVYPETDGEPIMIDGDI